MAKGLSTDRDYLVPSAAATSPAAVGEQPTVPFDEAQGKQGKPLAVSLATPSFSSIDNHERIKNNRQN